MEQYKPNAGKFVLKVAFVEANPPCEDMKSGP